MTHACKGVCKTARFDQWKLKQTDIITKDTRVKKCSECDNIKFFNFDIGGGYRCPCCGNGLKTRKTYCKEKRQAKELRQTNDPINLFELSSTESRTITVNGREVITKLVSN